LLICFVKRLIWCGNLSSDQAAVFGYLAVFVANQAMMIKL
jgi:hypothetical protein